MKTVEDVANIYPDYSWVVFPRDDLVKSFVTKIPLGLQTFDLNSPLPYCLIGHMSERLTGKTNKDIRTELESVIMTTMVPILCVGPIQEKDTLESVLKEQLIVLERWPKDKKIIIAYEPGFAIGNGKTMTLEDIEIVTDILREALKDFTNKNIIYGGSVNDNNIV